jgi:excinuclease ABC subunit A
MASGPPSVVLASDASPTARALREEREVVGIRARLGPAKEAIVLEGASANNLDIASVKFPTRRFNVVAGVSGSGKSTLVSKVLYPAARHALGLTGAPVLAPSEDDAYDRIRLPKEIERAILVDQSPIGRTPRSAPATFLGVWDEVRKLFAASTEAKVRGYTPSRFSFNSNAGGRCSACDGQGVTSHEMSFLPDVTTPCPACRGARFEPETLGVKYLGLNIGEVLDLSAEEAAGVFAAHPRVSGPLAVMRDLGVGYLKIGQGSHTLSGGEAQRLKLAAELSSSPRTRPTLYVLDEPTTGLHWADVTRLISVLDRLVQRGDTLVIIEHHPGVMAAADHLIELGPEGGAGGGRVIASGPPEDVALLPTPTGIVLRELLSPPPRRGTSAAPKRRRAASALVSSAEARRLAQGLSTTPR